MYTAEHFSPILFFALFVHVSATSTLLLSLSEHVLIQAWSMCGPLNFIIWAAEFDEIIKKNSKSQNGYIPFFKCLYSI